MKHRRPRWVLAFLPKPDIWREIIPGYDRLSMPSTRPRRPSVHLTPPSLPPDSLPSPLSSPKLFPHLFPHRRQARPQAKPHFFFWPSLWRRPGKSSPFDATSQKASPANRKRISGNGPFLNGSSLHKEPLLPCGPLAFSIHSAARDRRGSLSQKVSGLLASQRR